MLQADAVPEGGACRLEGMLHGVAVRMGHRAVLHPPSQDVGSPEGEARDVTNADHHAAGGRLRGVPVDITGMTTRAAIAHL